MFIMVNVDDESAAVIRSAVAEYGDIYTADHVQGALALMSQLEDRDLKCQILFANMELSDGDGLLLLKEIRKAEEGKDFVTKVILIVNNQQTARTLNHFCLDTEFFLFRPIADSWQERCNPTGAR